MSKRFFAFGCSYTDYPWATWADLLCHHYHLEGWEVYNYGNSGQGNQHVLDSLVQADVKHNIDDEDVICVLWSSWAREDKLWPIQGDIPGRVKFGKYGSIVNANEPIAQDFVRSHFLLENYIMKNITAIVAANRAYNINYQSHITSNEEYDDKAKDQGDELLKEFCNFKPENRFYDTTDQAYTAERRFAYEQMPQISANDGHPPPGAHLAFVKHKVAPALGITLRPESIAWMKREHKEVQVFEKTFDSGDTRRWYRYKLELRKRTHLTFMHDWRELWGSFQNGEDGLAWGNVNEGILEGFRRAIDKKKLS